MLNYGFIREVGTLQWSWRTIHRSIHKRLLRRPHTLVLPTGLPLLLPIDSCCATEVFVTRANMDWGSERLLFSLLKNRGAFLDVGANIGYYSLYMLPGVQRVVAFEPDPRARRHLERNLRGHPSATIVPKALAARPGTMRFALEHETGLSHIVEQPLSQSESEITVDASTIDQFVRENGLTVEAVKIDAEGWDLEIIKGGLETIAAQGPVILTEATPRDELFDVIEPLDYRVYAFTRDHGTRSCSFQPIARGSTSRTKMLFLVRGIDLTTHYHALESQRP